MENNHSIAIQQHSLFNHILHISSQVVNNKYDNYADFDDFFKENLHLSINTTYHFLLINISHIIKEIVKIFNNYLHDIYCQKCNTLDDVNKIFIAKNTKRSLNTT